MEENAKLNYLDLTGENNIFPKISHKFCDIAKNSTFNHFGLRLNSLSTRTEIELHLNGQGINTSIANISLINKRDHFSDENILVRDSVREWVRNNASPITSDLVKKYRESNSNNKTK